MFTVDWHDLFAVDTSLMELVIRGTIIYLSLFVLLRVVLRRESGAVGVTYLLVIVLLAEAAQNGMTGSYNSIPEGIVLVMTIVFWAFVLDWLGYRVPRIQRFVHPKPLPLVKDGELLRNKMRRELITEDELMNQLRLQGLSGLSEVKEAYMESNGRISIIEYDAPAHRAPERPPA